MIIIPKFLSTVSFFNSCKILYWMLTSRAVVGSSAIIKSGSQLIASAITTLCLIPPLNWWG